MRPGLPLLAVVLLGAVAHAQVDPAALEAAKNHYAAGKAYYQDSHWPDALREFSEAYRLSKRPALLYNIGLCEEKMGHPEQAVASLRQYLQLEPQAADRGAVEKKIADLSAAGRVEDSVPVAPIVRGPPAGAATPAPSSHRRVYTWIVGGVGLALLGASAVTGVIAHSDYNTLVAECGPTHTACPSTYGGTHDQGEHLQAATWGLVGAGAVVLAGGVALYFLEPKLLHGSTQAMVVPVLVPGGGGLAGVVRF